MQKGGRAKSPAGNVRKPGCPLFRRMEVRIFVLSPVLRKAVPRKECCLKVVLMKRGCPFSDSLVCDGIDRPFRKLSGGDHRERPLSGWRFRPAVRYRMPSRSRAEV